MRRKHALNPGVRVVGRMVCSPPGVAFEGGDLNLPMP